MDTSIQRIPDHLAYREPLLSVEGWQAFLDDWAARLLPRLREEEAIYLMPVEVEALTTDTLAFPGAAEEEVEACEERLGVRLPPSFRRFLQASNGCRVIPLDAESALLYGTAAMDWFRTLSPESVQGWIGGVGELRPVSDAEYFVYGAAQDPVYLRDEYLQTALQISDEIDAAVLLLNPRVHSADHEWEAWFFGYHLPGAMRFRTFQEMMVWLKEQSLASFA